MNLCKAILLAGISALFSTTTCFAQMDGAAPLPTIKKPEGPTVEETLQWIDNKLISYGQLSNHSGWAFYEENTNTGVYSFRLLQRDCNMLIASVYRRKEDSHTYSILAYRFGYLPLHKLDVDKTQVLNGTERDRMTVQLRTIGDIGYLGYSYSTNYLSPDAVPPFMEDSRLVPEFIGQLLSNTIPIDKGRKSVERFNSKVWEFYVPDQEEVTRLMSALKHAALLCRNKDAQEKAAQPEKPKELF